METTTDLKKLMKIRARPSAADQKKFQERIRIAGRYALIRGLGQEEVDRIVMARDDRHIERLDRTTELPLNLSEWIEEDIRDCADQVESISTRLWRYKCVLEPVAHFDEDDAPLDRDAQLFALIDNVDELLTEAREILAGNRPMTLFEERVFLADDHVSHEEEPEGEGDESRSGERQANA